MSVVDGLAALPGDLRRRPDAAVSLAAAIVAIVSLPVSVYGGNIGLAAAQSCVALAALWNADQIVEGEP